MTVHSSVNGVEETVRCMNENGLRAEIVERRPGPLGPLLAERAEWLRREGMLDGEQEEIVVVRGVRA
jgi:hypothetical protein